MPNNTTDCYDFFNGTDQLIISQSVYGVSLSIALVSSLTAIVFILVAKAHKEFTYRLLLYMAVDTFPGCFAMLAFKFETDYNVRYEIAKPTNLIVDYIIYVYCFLLCWLGLYLFSLAVFRVQLNKTKHEAIGLVTVLVTPLTFLWVFPWKLRTGNWCTSVGSKLKVMKLIFFFNIPAFSLVLVSCLFIGAVLITLCKNAVNRAENTLQQQHRKALRGTIPLVVFMIVHQLTMIAIVVILACQLYLAEEGENAPFLLWVSFDFWPLIVASLPILLLCQPHLRRRVKCRKLQHSRNACVTSGYGTTVHQSSHAAACYSSHYESSHTTVTDQTSTTHYSTPCAECPLVNTDQRDPLF